MDASTLRVAEGSSPRILFVDCFDSFTNNIIGLLEEQINATVTMVHMNDKSVDTNLEDTLSHFDAVVIGPGPGHPSNPQDIGFIPRLWELSTEHLLPIFGICLGFQSLSFAHGADITRLSAPRHGIVSTAEHQATDIFAGIGRLEATQYHSLRADLRLQSSDGSPALSPSWSPSPHCPLLQPLAWDLSDSTNGPILMGVRHVEKPFWGVQFHPESICTSQAGKQLLANWWVQAQAWTRIHNRPSIVNKESYDARAPPPNDRPNHNNSHPGTPNKTEFPAGEAPVSHMARTLKESFGSGEVLLRWGKHSMASMSGPELIEALGHEQDEVILLDSQGHFSGRYTIIGLVTPGKTMRVTYQVRDKLLQYGTRQGGMYSSYLDSIEQVWPMLQEALDLYNPQVQSRTASSSSNRPDFGTATSAMDNLIRGHLPDQSPFWGGFVGYFSYEAGLETIDVDLTKETSQGDLPDINLAFIHRSIVIDHEMSEIYIQSLLPGDWNWILNVGRILAEVDSRKEIMRQRYPMTPDMTPEMTPIPSPGGDAPIKRSIKESPSLSSRRDVMEKKMLDAVLSNVQVTRPEETSYRKNVLLCQEYLSTGDSYELCLTDRTEIRIPTVQAGSGGAESSLDPWALYKRLRANNPSPFGAFMNLSGSVVVGSSPERFLRWTRDGMCQFRPIKGTVKKGGNMTREKAHEILNSSKERAENLMIVDLIRHDLSGVIGAANTWVSKLMVVEEYEKVYQLVSVIEGQLPRSSPLPSSSKTMKPLSASSTPEDSVNNASERTRLGTSPYPAPNMTGMHVLKASLPPGSMTGAPKKRSCEILQQIEKRPRGIYSGVLGYMDVGGAGDFSVVIRTAIKAGGGMMEAQQSSPMGRGLGISHASPSSVGGSSAMSMDAGIKPVLDGSYFPTLGLGNVANNTSNLERPENYLAETWRVGAGGAVTIQSTDEGEFLEMETKAGSVLGALFWGDE